MSPDLRLPRRQLIVLALAALAAPARAASPEEDRALVERARAYLRSLSSAIGRFSQTDPRGRLTTGTFYLKRPGRARFDYDPPSGLSVASNGFRVAIRNARLGTLDAYPLGSTPLGVLLSNDIRIDKSVAIGAVRQTADGFSIATWRSAKRNEGEMTLEFRDRPLALAGWTITDARGALTRVTLNDFGPSKPLPNSFFELKPPPARPQDD